MDIKKFAWGLALAGLVFVSNVAPAKAATLAEMQAQVSAILEQVQVLPSTSIADLTVKVNLLTVALRLQQTINSLIAVQGGGYGGGGGWHHNNGLRVTVPNGGEQWQLGSTHTVLWTPYDPTRNLNRAGTQVKAYLLKMENGSLVNKGEIIESGKASIHWNGDLGTYGNMAVAGDNYYVKLVNNVTGETDISDAPFKLVPQNTLTATLRVNGSHSPITQVPVGGQNYTVDWTSNASQCSLSVSGPDSATSVQYDNLGPAGDRTIRLYPNSYGVSLWCKSSYPIEGTAGDYIDGPYTNNNGLGQTSVTVTSPNGGQTLPLNNSSVITWSMNAVNKVSIGLYRNDASYAWIVRDMAVSGANGSYNWTPSSTLSSSEVSSGAVYKIYIIGYRPDGTGTVEDKSDSAFSISGGTVISSLVTPTMDTPTVSGNVVTVHWTPIQTLPSNTYSSAYYAVYRKGGTLPITSAEVMASSQSLSGGYRPCTNVVNNQSLCVLGTVYGRNMSSYPNTNLYTDALTKSSGTYQYAVSLHSASSNYSFTDQVSNSVSAVVSAAGSVTSVPSLSASPTTVAFDSASTLSYNLPYFTDWNWRLYRTNGTLYAGNLGGLSADAALVGATLYTFRSNLKDTTEQNLVAGSYLLKLCNNDNTVCSNGVPLTLTSGNVSQQYSAPVATLRAVWGSDVQIDWTNSGSVQPVTYEIYRKAGTSGFTEHETGIFTTQACAANTTALCNVARNIPSSTSSYRDGSTKVAGDYRYAVVAHYTQAQWDYFKMSNLVSATAGTDINTGMRPSYITNLSATVSGSSIVLSWTKPTGHAAYDVYRSTSPTVPLDNTATRALQYQLNKDLTYYTDTTAVAGTTYYYIVVPLSASHLATGSNTNSNSNVASATVPGGSQLPDLVVTNITATSISSGSYVTTLIGGVTYNFTATIMNIGSGASTPTSFTLNGSTQTVQALGPGQSTTLSSTSGLSLPRRTPICSRVDLDHNIVESNENNNDFCQEFPVTASYTGEGTRTLNHWETVQLNNGLILMADGVNTYGQTPYVMKFKVYDSSAPYVTSSTADYSPLGETTNLGAGQSHSGVYGGKNVSVTVNSINVPNQTGNAGWSANVTVSSTGNPVVAAPILQQPVLSGYGDVSLAWQPGAACSGAANCPTEYTVYRIGASVAEFTSADQVSSVHTYCGSIDSPSLCTLTPVSAGSTLSQTNLVQFNQAVNGNGFKYAVLAVASNGTKALSAWRLIQPAGVYSMNITNVSSATNWKIGDQVTINWQSVLPSNLPQNVWIELQGPITSSGLQMRWLKNLPNTGTVTATVPQSIDGTTLQPGNYKLLIGVLYNNNLYYLTPTAMFTISAPSAVSKTWQLYTSGWGYAYCNNNLSDQKWETGNTTYGGPKIGVCYIASSGMTVSKNMIEMSEADRNLTGRDCSLYTPGTVVKTKVDPGYNYRCME